MLAIDLGGTRIKAGHVQDGVVSGLVAVPHRSSTLAGALTCLEQVLEELGVQGGLGLSLPGLIGEHGEILALPGKLEGAAGFDLVGWLTQYAPRPLVVNDAIAYGVGEAGASAGRTLVMTIGTGVGCCVVEDGRPLGRGPLGGGQLSGQLPLTSDGPLDTSGRPGTIEAWCRSERILAEVRYEGADVSDLPAALAAAALGQPAALRGLASYRSWLARAIGALCLAHGPDAVVVGGGPVQDGGPVLEGIADLVRPHLWAGQQVTVRAARHGDAAALVGLEVLHRGL